MLFPSPNKNFNDFVFHFLSLCLGYQIGINISQYYMFKHYLKYSQYMKRFQLQALSRLKVLTDH